MIGLPIGVVGKLLVSVQEYVQAVLLELRRYHGVSEPPSKSIQKKKGSSGLDHRRRGATPNPPKIRFLEESKRGKRNTIVVAKAVKK